MRAGLSFARPPGKQHPGGLGFTPAGQKRASPHSGYRRKCPLGHVFALQSVCPEVRYAPQRPPKNAPNDTFFHRLQRISQQAGFSVWPWQLQKAANPTGCGQSGRQAAFPWVFAL